MLHRAIRQSAVVCSILTAVALVSLNYGRGDAQGSVTIQVDAAANRRPIDPRIYGLAHADNAALTELRGPFHRWGGNVSTRHNWELNASNRGKDWYFESLADGPATPSGSADTFITASKSRNAEPSMTIPTLGWVAKVAGNRSGLASFSIAKYGAQTGSDAQWFADAGNGIAASNNQPITGNDPNDANVPSTPAFQRRWVQHLVNRFGLSSGSGVRYYTIDNEPSLWHDTHRDVSPNGASMDQVLNATINYATEIKAVDPGAQVLGPEEWGWSGYLYSGRDLQWGARNGWNNLPDRAAHNNQDYLPWYLDQLRQRHASTGQRLLDIFTVHYYPQGGEYGNDTSTTMQRLRNRSTRSLWDPAYVDQSWINTQVRLIPRLKEWVATHYPGTKIGITEYNWGAENHINGATTQADVLGIFGREGIDVANFWTFPPTSSPTFKAFKMYRNYDNNGGAFGDTSIRATAPEPDLLSVFAAQRSSDSAVTIMAINKDLGSSAPVNIQLANVTVRGAVQVWRLTSSNTIARLADVTASNATISSTLPAQSITLFVVPAGASTPAPVPSAPSNLRILSSLFSSTGSLGF